MNIRTINARLMTGVTLLEVLMGIVIFAVGMLALAQLQGGIARSSADANARTVATNLAEQIIEDARSFQQIALDPSGAVTNTYAGIAGGTLQETVGNLVYDITLTVQEYYFDADGVTVSGVAPDGRAEGYSDFKYLVVDVVWSTNDDFAVGDGTTAEIDSGSIRLAELIPSISPYSSLMMAAGAGAPASGPIVDYSPGANPDILAITLDDDANSRFKESSTPLPDVRRGGDLVETWLDVVTYNRSNGVGDATFLRREEFLAVSCECTLRIPTTDDQGGLRPTVWTGLEYTDGEFVSKPYGESASNSQSAYCNQCCANHHDDETDTSASASYDPTRSKVYWDSGPLAGDHQHWGYDDLGMLVLAQNDGDHYEEACRMIRVNGWFRVAQDVQMQDLLAFPEGYLEFSTGASAYSDHVVTSVEDWYTTSPAALAEPATPFPAKSQIDAAPIPNELNSTAQQLRSRGIYIDYLTPEAETIVDCLYQGGSGEECDAPGVDSWLEVYPFFDVQLTWLSRWNEIEPNIIVDVTNDPVATDNTHDRGRAMLQPNGEGLVKVIPEVHSGNLGLTATEAIDNDYEQYVESDFIMMVASENFSSPNTGNVVISGSITSGVGGVKAANIVVQGTNSLCSRTDVGYACLVQTAAGAGSVTVSNYYKANQTLYACSDALGTISQSFGAGASTTFSMPASGESIIADIVIKTNGC